MESNQPIRFLVVLSADKGCDISAGAVTLARLAAPYYLLKDDGSEVVLATLSGGYPNLPDYRDAEPHEASVLRFLNDREAREDLADTLAADQIVSDDFDAALCFGFPGLLWDGENNRVATMLTSLLESGKPVAIISDKGVDISFNGAGDGLLIFGGSDEAPSLAAHALMMIVRERRKRSI